ncbi:MAG: hypothetical protein ACLUHE_16400 [Christensenellales bacterium]
MVDAGIDGGKPFLALHLSGGTTEILLCENGRLTLLGGSLDLHAGQLVDRTGVRACICRFRRGLRLKTGDAGQATGAHRRIGQRRELQHRQARKTK